MATNLIRGPQKFLEILVFLVATCLANLVGGQGIEFESTDAIGFGSLFQYSLENSKAIERGDVLIRVNRVFDSVNPNNDQKPQGLFLEREEWMRTIFDLRSGKFAFYAVFSESTLDFSRPEELPDQKSSGNESFCIDLEADFIKRPTGPETSDAGPVKPYLSNEGSVEPILSRYGQIDVLAMGISPLHPSKRISNIEPWFSERRSGKGFLSGADVGKGLTRVKFVAVQRENNGDSRCEVDFEHSTNMPVKFLGQRWSERGQRYAIEYEDKMAWEDRGGLMLLKSLHHRNPHVETCFDGSKAIGYQEVQYDLHWLSVNNEIDPQFFDGSRIGGIENRLRWVDPRLCGATSLLPVEKDGKTEDPIPSNYSK